MLKDEKSLISNKTIKMKIQELKDHFKQIWYAIPRETAAEAGKATAYRNQRIIEHIFPWLALVVVILTLTWELIGLNNTRLAVVALVSFIVLLIYSIYMSSNRKKIFSDDLEEKKSERILKDLDKYFDSPDEVFADGDEKLQVMIDALEDENSSKSRNNGTVSSVVSAGSAVGVGFLQIILDEFNVDPFEGPDYFGIIFTLIMMCPLWIYLIIDLIGLIKREWLTEVLLRNLKRLRANRRTFASDDLDYLNQYYARKIMHNTEPGTEEMITKTEQYSIQLLNTGRKFFNDGDYFTAEKYFKNGFNAITTLESSLCDDDHAVNTDEVTQLRKLLSDKISEAEKMCTI